MAGESITFGLSKLGRPEEWLKTRTVLQLKDIRYIKYIKMLESIMDIVIQNRIIIQKTL